MDTGALLDDYLSNPDPQKPQLKEPSPLTSGHGDPAAQTPTVAPKPAPTQNDAVNSLYNDLYQHTANTNPQALGQSGASPDQAIDKSPLSLMDRGYLGWARVPKEQYKFLKTKFDDVQFVPTAEGGRTFVVKNENGQSKFSLEGRYR